MQLVCCACGESFEFTERDIEFYKKNGWRTLPKTCKKCRKTYLPPVNGFKKNNFLENASVYGMPYNVEGGTTVEYTYEIRVKSKDILKYVYYCAEENAFYLTEKREQANRFLREDAKKIEEEYKKISDASDDVECIPYGHYETLRNEYK